MTKSKQDNIKRNIIMPIIAIFVYLFIGIMAFPKKENIGNFSISYYIICAIFTLIIMFSLFKDDIKNDIKDFKKNIFKNLLTCLLTMLIAYVILCVANNLIYYSFGYSKIGTDSLVFPNMNNLVFYTIFVMVIYNPFVESMVFNLALKKIFNNNIIFIIISSISFGIMQVGIKLNMIIYAIPYILIAALISMLYVKKRNIFYPIFTWFIYYAVQLFIQSSAYWA